MQENRIAEKAPGQDDKAAEQTAGSESCELRYLDPRALRFRQAGPALQMTIENECTWLKVSILRVAPLSNAGRYFSVRDAAGKEIGILVDPHDLDADGRRLVEQDLERRYVVPVIRRIVLAKERFGTVDWDVETDRGRCRFTTRNLREDALQPSPSRYIITDVDGNHYDVADVNALDSASKGYLMMNL